MKDQAETSRTPGPHRDDSAAPDAPFPGGAKTLLLVEDRPLMGELFARAIEKVTAEWQVHVTRRLEEARPGTTLAVFNFALRDADPLFVAFVIQQLRAKLSGTPLFFIVDGHDPAVAGILRDADLQGWISSAMGFDAIVAAIDQAMAASPAADASAPPGRRGASPALRMAATPHAPSLPSGNAGSEIHLSLTEREIDVLSLLRKGKQNKAIAHALNISESTAKVHIRNIMRKFHLRNRTEVALLCGFAADRQRGGAPTNSDS